MEAVTNTQRMCKALVADDDPMIRMLAKATLENLGIEVDEATDGAAAVALFEEKAFDLVMLDLDMPRLNGFETCAKMRSMRNGTHPTIVIVTGKSDSDSIRQAYEVGATDFLIKPLNWQVVTYHIPFILRAQEALQSVSDSRAKLHEAQRIARIGGWDWFPASDEADWSDETYRILGLEPQSRPATYSGLLEAAHPQDRVELNRVISQAMEAGTSFSSEFRIPLPDTSPRIVICEGRVDTDYDGRPVRVHGVVQDITERREAEATIHRLAFYDDLTGLPNREMFLGHAGRKLALTNRRGAKSAVILVDLDRFKRINDSLGHKAGDELIRVTGERIADRLQRADQPHSVRTQDDLPSIVARPGGDEFMMLLSGLHQSESVANLLQQLLDDLSRPLQMGGQEVFVTASLGVSFHPDDGEDISDLLMNADTALASSKQDGGNCFRFFEKEMNVRAKERLSMESQLNRALDREEFSLFYQPQINLATGALEGFEALLRWFPEHAQGRPVSPGEFIPILEETGLISAVGDWVLTAACSQLRAWVDAGYDPTRISVNLSANQFRYAGLESSVKRALETYRLDPACLELELTESVIMQDAETSGDTLRRLKEIGLRLSVDDFGTGYSSMSYLKLFPLDALKIDRSFIMELTSDPNDQAIVRAIIAMSKGLGVGTVAEGVETAEQRALLGRIGCELAQGFLISRPVPAVDAAAFLRTQTPGSLSDYA